MSRKKSHVALFAGLGGFITAANKAGFETIYANDNDPYCCRTLNETYPDLNVSQTDIRKVSVENELKKFDGVDLLSAGFPCQSFSPAGDNMGFDDERGRLFFEIVRICKELNEPPKVVMLENVSFLKKFDNGARLATVLQHLRSADYWVSERHAMIINSKDLCGSAQNRERLFIVAYNSKYFKKNYFDTEFQIDTVRENLWDIIDRSKQVDPKYYDGLEKDTKYFDMIKESCEEFGRDRLYQVRQTRVRACPEGTCPTLTANMGGGGHNVPILFDDFGLRRLTENECLTLQGYQEREVIFPDKLNKQTKYSMIGNAIYPKVAEILMKRIDYSKVRGMADDKLEFPAQ